MKPLKLFLYSFSGIQLIEFYFFLFFALIFLPLHCTQLHLHDYNSHFTGKAISTPRLNLALMFTSYTYVCICMCVYIYIYIYTHICYYVCMCVFILKRLSSKSVTSKERV